MILLPTSQELAEYRRKNRFEVECSSGLKVLIRKIPIDPMFRILNKLQMNLSPGTTLEEAEKIANKKLKSKKMQEHLPELIRVVVPAVAINPRIVENSPGDKELAYEDVDYLDLLDIFFVALEKTGLSKESAEVRNSFRKKHSGPTGSGDVTSSPQATK